MNHDPGFHLSCDQYLSKGWGPPQLEPSEGKLDLEVDFYGKGLFPPFAYHSEGHQDGMGVCLYLALMRRVMGSRFTFTVLDDVVMSVDQGHRKQFCALLKARFESYRVSRRPHSLNQATSACS